MSDRPEDPISGENKDRRSLPERTIPLEDAARTCGVSVDTVRRWISSGRVKAYRLGPRFIRVDIDDLEKLYVPIGPGEL